MLIILFLRQLHWGILNFSLHEHTSSPVTGFVFDSLITVIPLSCSCYVCKIIPLWSTSSVSEWLSKQEGLPKWDWLLELNRDFWVRFHSLLLFLCLAAVTFAKLFPFDPSGLWVNDYPNIPKWDWLLELNRELLSVHIKGHLSCKKCLHDLQFMKKRILLTKPFQASQSWHQLSVYENKVLVQSCLQNERTLVLLSKFRSLDNKHQLVVSTLNSQSNLIHGIPSTVSKVHLFIKIIFLVFK